MLFSDGGGLLLASDCGVRKEAMDTFRHMTDPGRASWRLSRPFKAAELARVARG